MMYLRLGILWVLIILANDALAQEDSVRYLQEAEVHDTRLPVITPSAIPVQKFRSTDISKIQAVQVSDVVKRFAGVQVKDYGGIGGLKTVSVRGLGANHTAFSYDGITIQDGQTGQVDLGKYSIGNVDEVSLGIGNPEELLLPARAFASGSIINVKTASPKFAEGRNVSATVNLKTGSFGFFNPLAIVQNKLGKKVSIATLAEWQYADGQYPYTLDYGGITSEEERRNSDVNVLHFEEDVFLMFNDRNRLITKLYYYKSERGLPGATIFYNPQSSQRLWDENFFAQSRYEKTLTEKLEALFSVKYTHSTLRFLDPDYLNTVGELDNRYSQQEFYASAAGKLMVSDNIQLSLATDGFYNSMDANLYQFPYPSRFTSLTSLNAAFKSKHFNLQLGALNTSVFESTERFESAGDQYKFSPSVVAGYKPFGNEDWIVRFFYKNIFRMPTFNDLYYTGVGNTQLKPEDAEQFNLGIVHTKTWEKRNQFLSISVDGYYNHVTNKIVALPTRNLFIWSMMNMGIVQIKGVDVALHAGSDLSKSISLTIDGAYTFQQVLDKTDPESKTYNHQLAYTPVHSGSATLTLNTRILNVGYSLLFSGERYTLNHNIHPNRMDGYAEHGLLLNKKLGTGRLKYSISLEAINVFDLQYEVVKNFPMPGRSYRATLSLKL